MEIFYDNCLAALQISVKQHGVHTLWIFLNGEERSGALRLPFLNVVVVALRVCKKLKWMFVLEIWHIFYGLNILCAVKKALMIFVLCVWYDTKRLMVYL